MRNETYAPTPDATLEFSMLGKSGIMKAAYGAAEALTRTYNGTLRQESTKFFDATQLVAEISSTGPPKSKSYHIMVLLYGPRAQQVKEHIEKARDARSLDDLVPASERLATDE